eukprot:6847-Rhodomonas_salina.2
MSESKQPVLENRECGGRGRKVVVGGWGACEDSWGEKGRERMGQVLRGGRGARQRKGEAAVMRRTERTAGERRRQRQPHRRKDT